MNHKVVNLAKPLYPATVGTFCILLSLLLLLSQLKTCWPQILNNLIFTLSRTTNEHIVLHYVLQPVGFFFGLGFKSWRWRGLKRPQVDNPAGFSYSGFSGVTFGNECMNVINCLMEKKQFSEFEEPLRLSTKFPVTLNTHCSLCVFFLIIPYSFF